MNTVAVLPPSAAPRAPRSPRLLARQVSNLSDSQPRIRPLVSPGHVDLPNRPSRPCAISRRGIDHGWVALIACALALVLLGAPRLRAAEPMDAWTPISVPDTVIKSPTDMIHVDGAFWATGTTGRVQYSTDRSTWHVVQTPAAGTLRSIIHAQGRFVAVGDKLTIASSPDGTGNWTVHTTDPASTRNYHQVIYADGKFVAVGGRGQAAYSTDGVNWTPVTMANVNMYCTGVAWGNGLFVASGELDGYYCIATSPDGVTWTRRYVAAGYGYKAICFFNGLFIAGNVSELATSPDGTTWTRLTVPFQYTNMAIQGIKVLNGRAFAFGNTGLLMSSVDGTEWTTHTTGTTLNVVALDYDNDRLLAFRSGASASSGSPAASEPWAPVGGGSGGGDGGSGGGTGDAPCLANISTRAWIGAGDSLLISGFVIHGDAPKQVLIRAVGPTLTSFGVAGALADPQVRLVDHAGAELGFNNDWGTLPDQAGLTAATSAVHAFGLAAGSKDAAILTTLQPGLYTTQVSGVGSGTGIALVEVYDVTGGAEARFVNISSRGFVGTGASVAIPGFVVTGSSPRKLLVRGVGPTLGGFGVANTLVDPRITLLDANQVTLAQNDNWGSAADQAGLVAATSAVSAFALAAGSADAAMVVTVPPGVYTVLVSGANDGTGNALVEIYEVP